MAFLDWASTEADDPAENLPRARRALAPGELPPAVAAALWRGTELGSPVTGVCPTGFAALDAELPGQGWPRHALTEILQPQPSVTEWRLLGPAMAHAVAEGKDVVVIGPPKAPHLPGLQHLGLDERRLVWIKADSPAQRLWTTEQMIKSNGAGLVVTWLPHARQEEIRRLQVCAQGCEAPVFLCRPALAATEPSAASLRVQLRFDVDWALHLQIIKRKGATHEGVITLPSVPGGLAAILTPRLRQPSVLIADRALADHALSRPRALSSSSPVPNASHAVGRPDPRPAAVRSVRAH